MGKGINLWRGLTSLLAVLLALAIFMTSLLFSWSGQVNVFLDIKAPTLAATADSTYYDSAYGLSDEGLTAMLKDSDLHDVQTMTEGAVLILNENTALPLAESERRVTLFGRAVADPVYMGNSGGPGVDLARQVSLRSALEAEGFAMNETLFAAYAASEVKRAKAEPDWSIGEVGKAFYTAALTDSYASDYQDAAIVMFSRDGGEGKDLPTQDGEGISFLALHQDEKDLLSMIQSSGKFNKTIVLINSAYPMELGWLEENTYGVDAALWIGAPGLKGFEGVAQMLTGKADPSGRFVDTYAASSLSAPAVRNSGSFFFEGTTNPYIVQAENIYVGYKYYETRYQDWVLGVNNAAGTAGVYTGDGTGWNYGAEMCYPFGYGTSYATFAQELLDAVWDRENHQVTATVKVTNVGYPEGSHYTGTSKSVVQLYAQLPYQSGQAEKSAVQLIGFGKTGSLGAGESEEVSITVDDYLFATYDAKAANGADSGKQGCYVFDAGDYYFTVGDNAHDALNNALAAREGENVAAKLVDAKGVAVAGDASKARLVTLESTDNTTYATSQHSGEIVSNQYDDIDLNHFQSDAVTYLTRDDWNTYPVPYTGVTLTDEMSKLLGGEEYAKPADAPAYDSFTREAPVTLRLIDMKDVPFEDDETWNRFLDQLSLSDLSAIPGENFGQPAIASIGKPANTNTDGPGGSQGNYSYGSKASATQHVSEIVAAATWNQELLAQRGSFIAEDCLFSGTMQLWSPGANLHRTPFSGRNFEYYSEDSILSYLLSAVQTRAMQEKGLNASIKHFCANDQETNRTGLATLMNEQTFRQGPLKGFEGAFTEGGALGTMLSCSRVGLRLSYEDKATLTQVLRNEWGFQGVTITDSVKGAENLPTIPCLIAGVDTFNADANRGTEIKKYLASNQDGYVLQCLREANKRFYFAAVNSNLMNGLTAEVAVTGFVPWWQTALKAAVGVLGVATLACAGMFVFQCCRVRGKEEKEHV